MMTKALSGNGFIMVRLGRGKLLRNRRGIEDALVIFNIIMNTFGTAYDDINFLIVSICRSIPSKEWLPPSSTIE